MGLTGSQLAWRQLVCLLPSSVLYSFLSLAVWPALYKPRRQLNDIWCANDIETSLCLTAPGQAEVRGMTQR